jgi:uncharacterized UPF0160 family protein
MKTLVTHNGTFHADDVFAVATFLLANNQNNDWQVVRSRDESVIEKADAAIDVGGVYDIARLRFDHHQKGGAGNRDNKILYASFGLVWNIFGEMICGGKKIADEIEKKIVVSVDARDNGIDLSKNIYEDVPAYEISDMVSDFNITWKEESGTEDGGDKLRYDAFIYLVSVATKLIQRMIIRVNDKYEAREFVVSAYNESEDKRVIVMDRFYPWQDVLIDLPEPLFVIFPNSKNDAWTVKTIPKDKSSFESKLLFPESWAGLRDGECALATTVQSAYFVHNARFIACTKTKEDAIALAGLALK